MVGTFGLRGSVERRRPLRKSSSWRRKYSTGNPAMGAFSGRPPPLTRWQIAQARFFSPSAAEPCCTTSGIGACSSGNQSTAFAQSLRSMRA
jgi:hypothetical protein